MIIRIGLKDFPEVSYITRDANGKRMPRKNKKKFKRQPDRINFKEIGPTAEELFSAFKGQID